jgi:hypothetical protein
MTEMRIALKYKEGKGCILGGNQGEKDSTCHSMGTDLTRLLQRADAWGVGVFC